jgi:pectate lyase
MNSVVISENNVLSARIANNPTATLDGFTRNAEPSGTVYSINDTLVDSASWRGQVQFAQTNPISLPYNYQLIDSSDIIEYVTTNAGAGKADKSNSCEILHKDISYTLE